MNSNQFGIILLITTTALSFGIWQMDVRAGVSVGMLMSAFYLIQHETRRKR